MLLVSELCSARWTDCKARARNYSCRRLNKCLVVELPIGFLMSDFLVNCLSKLGFLRMHLFFPTALKMGTWAVNTEVKHSLTSLTCYDHSLSHKSQEKVVCKALTSSFDITKMVQAKISVFIFHFNIPLTSDTGQRAPLFFTVQNVSVKEKKPTCCRFSSSKSKALVIAFHILFRKIVYSWLSMVL